MSYVELNDEVYLQAGNDEDYLMKLIRDILTDVLDVKRLDSVKVEVSKHG